MKPLIRSSYQAEVIPEWIDYNGHMNLAYYVLAFDHATDRLLEEIGIGNAYRQATGCSTFVLEAHVTYEQEMRLGDAFAIATRLIDADRKLLHLFHTMIRADGDEVVATTELLALHVDRNGPRAAPLPEATWTRIEALLAAHRQIPLPPQLGRKIGIRR